MNITFVRSFTLETVQRQSGRCEKTLWFCALVKGLVRMCLRVQLIFLCGLFAAITSWREAGSQAAPDESSLQPVDISLRSH